MIDFAAELERLIALEPRPLAPSPLSELLGETARSLTSVDKKQADLALQIEEIYDIVSGLDASDIKDQLKDERRRCIQLLSAAVAVCDIIGDFSAFARRGGDSALAHQAELMQKSADTLLQRCGVVRFGKAGEPLDPAAHSVQGTAASSLPREYVTEVLQSGYLYMGNIVRKASVILSDGTGEA